jgi:hypothetical protein
MAAEPRNLSGEPGWSRSDIVEMVALIIGIPAAIGAVFMLVIYYKQRSQGTRGETLFLRDSRRQRPLGASSVSHTEYLLSPSCDSYGPWKVRTSDETAMPTTSVDSERMCSCACNCTSK